MQNGADVNFGTFAAAVTVTHVRCRRASDNAQPVVKAITAVAVGASEQFQLDAGDIDWLYRSGELGDTHMQAVC